MKLTGTTLNNYTFEQEIGEGGMANVYVATHNALKQKVAIKVLNENYVHNRNIRNRFLAEARNMAAMSHTNVVKVFDLIDAGDVCAIVMEYIEGITLEEHIRQHAPLRDFQIKHLLEQMLRSLEYIHDKKFIHRDVKPSNFMITPDDTIKLLDFGIAKDASAENVDYTHTGLYQQMGTPIYMSPEQIQSSKNVDSRTDIYSLGVVLYQLVSGKRPYSFETSSLPFIQMKIIEERLPSTHSKWDHFIAKATEKNSKFRYPSAKAWLEDLKKNDDETIVETPKRSAPDTPRPTEPQGTTKNHVKKSTFYAITGVLTVLLLSFFFLAFFGNSGVESALNSFVLVEEGLQIAVENEFSRGEEKYSQLMEVSEDKTQKDLQRKAEKLMIGVNQIDNLTAKQIKFLDDLKLELLTAAGEDVSTIGAIESIIVKSYDPREPLKPSRMHLTNIQKKGETIPMTKSSELWASINQYRKELTELMASSQINEPGRPSFYFNDPEINTYADFRDLNEQIDQAISNSNVSMDDREAIKSIYLSLTRPAEINGEPYFDNAFDGAPLVSAIGILTSLQKEILTARANAVSLIRSRVGGGEYSFDKIMALAYGPDLVNPGETIEIQVLMAAFDSEKQPKVTVNGGTVAEVRDGKAIIRMKAAQSGEMKITGTISILSRSGIPKTMPWEKSIKIVRPN